MNVDARYQPIGTDLPRESHARSKVRISLPGPFTSKVDSRPVIDSGEEVPREQKMLKGYLPRVIHHQVY